jgi:arylsulfatase A-like enzyme
VADNAGKRPFFLYVPFNAVHSPYQPPKGGVDAYPDLKGVRRDYAAMLTAVDDANAEVVAAVEKAGVRDNTLFIFSSDNGGPAPGRITDNGPYRGGKGQVYEGGVRVAASVTWDGHIPAGSKSEQPIHAVDWRPTLQKLCGAKPTGDLPMDGLDAWQTISADAKSPHDVILLNTAPAAGAVRAGDWKLVIHRDAPAANPKRARKAKARQQPAGEKTELFNLHDDPYEKTNLAGEHPEKVAELKKRLEEFAEQAVPPKARPMPKDFVSQNVWGEFGG